MSSTCSLCKTQYMKHLAALLRRNSALQLSARMYSTQDPCLPVLGHDDLLRRIAGADGALDHSWHDGEASSPTEHVFEAKALNLVPRPKTSSGAFRSSPGSRICSPSSNLQNTHQLAPRYDQETTRPPSAETTRRLSVINRWCSTREKLDRFATSFSVMRSFAPPPPESSSIKKIQDWSDRRLNPGKTYAHSSGSSSGRVEPMQALRRTGMSAEMSGPLRGNIAVGSSTVSIIDSDDSEVLRREIRRLQTALLSEFKGGNRFVGGAQFKASVRRQSNGCGGCLQVREALRRSRAENRDFRAGLFRAEATIKQLTLVKGIRRSRAKARQAKDKTPTWTLSDTCGSDKLRDTDPTILSDRTAEACGQELFARIRDPEGQEELEQTTSNSHSSVCVEPVTGAEQVPYYTEVDSLKQRTNESFQPISTEEAQGLTARSCRRCPELAAQVEEGRSKINELARRNHDQQQELERLRQVEAEFDVVRARLTERRQRLEVLEQTSEEQAHVRQQLEREVRRVCNQNADMVSQASATTSRLKKTQRDLHTAREALDAERSVRERGEVTVGVLERELMEERVGCDKLRKEAVMEREMRRQSDIQASATESARKKALKAALNSSVRLCIVAPTVNINLDERSRSFCSGLPEEKIREFVERSVLPRFTRVLLQPSVDTARVTSRNSEIVNETASTEVAAPSSSVRAAAGKSITDDFCGRQSPEKSWGKGDEYGCRSGDNCGREKEGFDSWLRDLLVDMQTSIEKHVATVFQTQAKQAASGSVLIR